MRATLTTRGMYNIYDVLFDGLNVPDGMVKQVAVDNILSTTDGLETLYPNPPMLASLISQWASVMRPIWAKLFETTQLQYDPIYNYDRTEEHSMSGSDVHSTAGTVTDTTTSEETHEETVSGSGKETPSGTEKQKASENVAAFNTDSASVPSSVTETEISFTNRETQRTANTTTNRENMTESSGTKTTKDTLTMEYGKKETVRAFGNIGVTTTQQMIQSEREVVQFSVYQVIADDFKQRFCIMVY